MTRVEVGPRGAYKGLQTPLSPFPDVAKRMLETLVDYFLSVRFSRRNFPHSLYPLLNSPPPSLFSIFLFDCVSLGALNAVIALTFARAIFSMWMQRRQHSDVNVTTGHVATFNNAARLRGKAGESDRTMIAGERMQHLGVIAAASELQTGLAGRLVSRRRPQ